MSPVASARRLLLTVAALLAPCAALAEAPHVVFVTGDCEYRSEISMPAIANILEKRHGMRTTVCYAIDPKTGKNAPKYLKNIEGLEALADADLAVFFVRYRQLPDDQLRRIIDFAKSDKPMIGLRTATHAFSYTEGPNARWNDGFGKEFFGQTFLRHHGHDSHTNAYVALEHPITRGLAPSFRCASWLYNVMPLPADCRTLLVGAALKNAESGNRFFGEPNPVAWTRELDRKRIFFTTLGHPEDFTDPSMRRLLVNAVYWSLGREDEIPPEGANVEWTQEYVAPTTTQAIPNPARSRNAQAPVLAEVAE